jgi:hypothetical protein
MRHCQRKGDGNRGINRIAATLHNVNTNARSKLIGRRNNPMACAYRLT